MEPVKDAQPKPVDDGARWQEYEARKQAWAAAHPGATDAEYRWAIREIADDLGI